MSNQIHDLISRLISETRARNPGRPALIGVGGLQGSGKSFQCRAYVEANPRVAHFSLDDVYLTKAARAERADAIMAALGPHEPAPAVRELFITRGPPGTHDLGLAYDVIEQLRKPKQTALPRFDKRTDERAPEETWATFLGPAKAILIDGWCIGAVPPSRNSAPLNVIEEADVVKLADGQEINPWRDSIYEAMTGPYSDLFTRFDVVIYFSTLFWSTVRDWRREQEEETQGRPLTDEEKLALDRFLMHYERVSKKQMGIGRNWAHWIVSLNDTRAVVSVHDNR